MHKTQEMKRNWKSRTHIQNQTTFTHSLFPLQTQVVEDRKRYHDVHSLMSFSNAWRVWPCHTVSWRGLYTRIHRDRSAIDVDRASIDGINRIRNSISRLYYVLRNYRCLLSYFSCMSCIGLFQRYNTELQQHRRNWRINKVYNCNLISPMSSLTIITTASTNRELEKRNKTVDSWQHSPGWFALYPYIYH